MEDPQASTSYLLPSASQQSTSIYHTFASTLGLAKDRSLTELLDADGGVAHSFAQICKGRAEAVLDGVGASASTNPFDVESSEDSRSAWESEAQTWDLIQLLIAERLTRPSSSGQSVGHGNPYQTPLATVQTLLSQDDRLNELNILRGWLSSLLPPTSTIEVRRGYRTFTKARIRNERRVGVRNAQGTRKSMGVAAASGAKSVTSLDPDATCRGEGVLEQEDAIYERAVLRSLFEYARAGQLDLAMDLARQTGHSWRSASLRGGMLYWEAGLSLPRQMPGRDDGEIDVDEEIRQGLGDVNDTMGNLNRSLWKAVCAKVASNPTLDQFERALYGALCGDVQSVLPVSHTWAAQLWVHVNSVLETGLDEGLNRSRKDADGSWWSQNGLRDVEGKREDGQSHIASAGNLHEGGAVRLQTLKVPTSGASSAPAKKSASLMQSNSHAELEEIFNKLSQSNVEVVRNQSNEPFHVVQRAIIVDEVPAMLAMVESRLDGIREAADRAQYVRLVRFFAHFVLYLRLVGYTSPAEGISAPGGRDDRSREVDPAVCNSLLRAYVEVLQETQQIRQQQLLLHGHSHSLESEEAPDDVDELVAMYASALEPESAVRSFAVYLRSIDINAGVEVRRSAFKSAERHDLDLAAVARTTCALIFDEILPHFPLPPVDDEFSIVAFDDRIEIVEQSLIRAIDWLTFTNETHRDALVQSNLLMRLFFVCGRLQAARALLFNLPPSVLTNAVQVIDDESKDFDVVEHEEWKDFFAALDAHAFYAEVASRKPLERASKIDRHDWTAKLGEVAEKAEEAITSLLVGDWLKLELEEEDEETQRRLADLQRIRQIYIPELVLRLHFVHYDTRDILPSSLPRALELPTLVADERHKLYLEFVRPTSQRNRLREYLCHVREAALAGLDGGDVSGKRSDNPFAPVGRQSRRTAIGLSDDETPSMPSNYRPLTKPRSRTSFANAAGRILTIFSMVFIASSLLFSLGSEGVTFSRVGNAVSSSYSYLVSNGCDPFQRPGFVATLSSSFSSWRTFDPSCPSSALLPSLLRALNRPTVDIMGVEEVGRQQLQALLSNKTVLLVGDRVDHTLVKHFCALTAPNQQVQSVDRNAPWGEPLQHVKTSRASDASLAHFCYLREFDFVLMSTYHYGTTESEQEWSQTPNYMAPTLFESRVSELYGPMMKLAASGTHTSPALPPSRPQAAPDLVVFQSTFWDLARWAKEDLAAGHDPLLDLTEKRLLQWRSRNVDMLASIRGAWKDTPILWRDAHYPLISDAATVEWFVGEKSSTKNHPLFNHNRINSLNAAQQSVLDGHDVVKGRRNPSARLPKNVRGAPWGRISIGQAYKQIDPLAPSVNPGGSLFAEMLLFELSVALGGKKK